MRVFYDISVLGSGLYDKRSRTGVARYVENLRTALLSNEDVELTYCAFHSLKEYLQIKSNAELIDLGGSRLLSPSDNLCKGLALSLFEKIYPKKIESKNRQLTQIILDNFLRFLDQFSSRDYFFEKPECGIFHSTFFPLPNNFKKRKKFRRFITVHDLIPIHFPQFFERRQIDLSRRIFRSIGPDDWVVANSESTKKDLCNFIKIDPEKVFVTTLAASEIFYRCNDKKALSEVRERYGLPNGDYLLSVCTLEPRKNVDQVIRSFKGMVQQQGISDLCLVLVGGEGWHYERIFHEIDVDVSMQERIFMTGYVPDEDLAALYSGAMAFVYPSFYEGFGLPPLEAMQCGVPVIVSNTSSLPEVVGDCGILIDPNDGDGLSQAMLDLYSQPAMRKILSEKAIERAKFFSWEKCSRMTVSAYEAALFG